MKHTIHTKCLLAITGSSLLAISSASAADGTWIGDTNTASQWTNTALWQDGIIADGTDSTAFFTNDITANRTVALNGNRTIGNITFTDATPSHNLTISGNILTLDVTTGVPIIDVTNRTLTISSVVAGNDGLRKDGDGTLVLGGANTFTGNISINAGILQIGTGGSLGSGTYAGNISIASGARLQVSRNGSQTLSGVISGDGGLTKEGGGTLVLGNNNTYTGQTIILPSNNSTTNFVSVGSFNSVVGGTASSSLGAPTTVANGTIVMGAQGTGRPAGIQYTGAGETTDRVIDFRFNNNGSVHTISNTGEGLLKFTSTPTSNRSSSAGSGQIVLRGSGDGEFTQGIPIGVTITKIDSGTWTLGGPIGDGAVNVSAGTLLMNGDSSAATGAVTVGVAGTLGGNGTIGGVTTIEGILRPGTSPGVLSFTESLALTASSTTTFEINGLTRGTDYDGVNVGTTLGLGGGLIFDIGTILGASATFNLFDVNGGTSGDFATVSLAGAMGTGSFTFDNSDVWSLVDGGDNTWTFTQSTGDLSFTAIPEPATALLGGLGLLALLRRRRN